MKTKKNKVKTTYDDRSPVTGKFTVLSANDSGDVYKLCTETGYHTWWNAWKTTEENMTVLHELETHLPAYIANNPIVFQERVWYLFSDVSAKAAIFPVPDPDTEETEWTVFPVELIAPNEDGKFEHDPKQGLVTGIRSEVNGELVTRLHRVVFEPLLKTKSFEEAMDYYTELKEHED